MALKRMNKTTPPHLKALHGGLSVEGDGGTAGGSGLLLLLLLLMTPQLTKRLSKVTQVSGCTINI